MKRDDVNYLLVGCFVLGMLGTLFVLLYFVTGRTGPTDNYHVYYSNVAGLKFGTGVFYEGYRVGQIEQIEPKSGDAGVRYELTVSVAQGWRIPVDSVARIVSSGLISAVQINIEEGVSSKVIKPGGEIAGAEQADLFGALSKAAADFQNLSEQGIMPLLGNLNRRVSEVADEMVAFRREDLAPFVEMVHARVDEGLFDDMERVLARLDDSAGSLQKILGQDNQARVADFLVHIDDVALNLNQLISRIEATRMQMNGVLGALGTLVDENGGPMSSAIAGADSSAQEMRRSVQAVNEHLDTILYHVEGSARHMHEFTRVIRENPSRLLRGNAEAEQGTAQ